MGYIISKDHYLNFQSDFQSLRLYHCNWPVSFGKRGACIGCSSTREQSTYEKDALFMVEDATDLKYGLASIAYYLKAFYNSSL